MAEDRLHVLENSSDGEEGGKVAEEEKQKAEKRKVKNPIA
jgi:hypothetical protein